MSTVPQTFAVPYSRFPGAVGYNNSDAGNQVERGERYLTNMMEEIVLGKIGFPWWDFMGGQTADQNNPDILRNDNGKPIIMVTSGSDKLGQNFEVDVVEDPSVDRTTGYQIKALHDASMSAWNTRQQDGLLLPTHQTEVVSGLEYAYDWQKVYGRMEGWFHAAAVGFYDKQRYDKEDLLERAKINLMRPQFEYFFIRNFISVMKLGKDFNAILSLYNAFSDNWHGGYIPHAHTKTFHAFGQANDAVLGAWTGTGTAIDPHNWKISGANLMLLCANAQKAGIPMVTFENGTTGYHLIVQDDVFNQGLKDPDIREAYKYATSTLGADKSLTISGYNTGKWQSFQYGGIKLWKLPRSENTNFNPELEMEKLYGDGFGGTNLTVATTNGLPAFTGGTFTDTNFCGVPNALAANFCVGILLGAGGLWSRNMGSQQAAIEMGVRESSYKIIEGYGLLHPFAMGRMERSPKTMPTAFSQTEANIMSATYNKCNGGGIVTMAKPQNAMTWGFPWGEN